jgi:hypothetical protein
MVVRRIIGPALVAGLGLTLGIGLAAEDLAQPIRVTGEVTTVDATGTLFLRITDPAVPHRLRLWGVQITDLGAFSDFIVGRLIDCRVIYFIDELPYADCMAARNDFRVSVGPADLRLSAWLPEFGWAVNSCTEVDEPGWTIMTNNEAWGCSSTVVPLYLAPHERR